MAISHMSGLFLALLASSILILGDGRSEGVDFQVQRVATGLSNPVYVTAPPGDSSRLFIVESLSGYDPNGPTNARIKILNLTGPNAGTVNSTPFLDIQGIAPQKEDQGLFGLAFHPNYAQNGIFYVTYTSGYDGGTSHVVRYQVSSGNPDVANANSAMLMFDYYKPFYNHSADWLGFNPAETAQGKYNLYLTTGDGGGNLDSAATTPAPFPGDRAQNIGLKYGKVLRMDVGSNGIKDGFPSDPTRNYGIPSDNPFINTPGADPLVYDYGLRNPWRASFDRQTGDMYIGNVGANSYDEVELHKMNMPAGQNFGWSRKEGTVAGPNPTPAITGDTLPIYEKRHDGNTLTGPAISITGGYVYRGPVPSLQGQYFFADFLGTNNLGTGTGQSQIYSMIYDGSEPSTWNGTNYTNFQNITSQFTPNMGTIKFISSFGEDADGNLYFVNMGQPSTPTSSNRNNGEIYKIVYVPEPSSLLLATLGVAALAAARLRRNTGLFPA